MQEHERDWQYVFIDEEKAIFCCQSCYLNFKINRNLSHRLKSIADYDAYIIFSMLSINADVHVSDRLQCKRDIFLKHFDDHKRMEHLNIVDQCLQRMNSETE